MYLRAKKRIKDGKDHRYWSIVESCRNLDGRVVQRQVLYLGEINDSQKTAWCRTIDVLQTDSSAKQMALFPTDRQAPELECEVVQVKLNELRLHHPRQWGRVLAGAQALGAVGTRPVLAAAFASESPRHEVA